jgi:4-amino-4-deoxy-L-arabinose transferase-like glycosyltransferase
MTKEDEPKTEKKDDLAEAPPEASAAAEPSDAVDEKNPFAPRERDAETSTAEAAPTEQPKPLAPWPEAKTEEQEDEDAPLVKPDPPGPARWVPLAIAFGLPALLFFLLPPLTKSGLWDPFELNVADLARRLALNLHGATALALENADNSLPHLNDLGRPQLPFTSVALGFKYFGLHEWAGRAPLALWGLFGVLATYGFVSRLFDRRAGVYAAVALSTMPLYFVQARSILGDICTMSALAMAFGGLAVAVFDRDDDGPTPIGARLPWIVMAGLGLAAGWGSRGGLIGLGVPASAVGLAWALSWAGGRRRADGVGDVMGALSLVGGVAAIIAAVVALDADAPPKDLNPWIGAMVKTQAKYPTFDFYIGALGHALAPWSAFIPFAIGRLFLAPVGRVGAVYQRESWARMALIVGAAIAFGAHGLLSARTDLIAFCAPAILAAACGVAIRDFERGAHASIAVGVGTGVLLGVFHHDFHELPEKAYQAFAVVGATFPDSFKPTALSLWWVALGAFALVAFLTWVERDSKREPFAPANYLRVLRALREAWDGLLALAYFATVAGASLAGLFVWVGVRTHAKWLPVMSLQIRDGVLNAWWAIAFVPLGAILGIYFACDLWVWAFDRSSPFSKASLTRGFEPFEDLFKRLRSPEVGVTRSERIAGAVPAFFMVLAVPGGVLGYLLTHGTKPFIAAALAVPSGVAVFLLLGIAGDLVRHRAAALALGGALVGSVLCFAYYPALANQLSPKEVFESYRVAHKTGEPLALLGVGGRTAAYYAGGQPLTFNDAPSAYTWLKAATRDAVFSRSNPRSSPS